MRTNKVVVSEIKTRVDYVKTLQCIGVGETRSFKMTGKLYSGMHNARYRMREKGFDFLFETDAEKNLMHVTRIS